VKRACWLFLIGCAGTSGGPGAAEGPPSSTDTGPREDSTNPTRPDTAPPSWDTGDPREPCAAGLQVRHEGAETTGSLDLGEAPAYGAAVPLTLELSNPCEATLHFLGHPEGWVEGADFGLETLPPVGLAPGETAELRISFTPGESGAYTSALRLTHDQPGSPFELTLTGTAAAPRPLVLVGEGRRVSTTLDYGDTWAHDAWETLDAHTDVMQRGGCVGAGVFLSVGGSAEGRWWTSADGLTWADHRDPAMGAIAGCAHDGTRFVAAAGAPFSSADGMTWTAGDSTYDPDHLRAMTWADGWFVAVGDSGRVARTADGVAWTTDSHAGTDGLGSIAAGGGVLVAVGAAGAIATSTDAGATWSTQVIGTGHAWSGVVYGQDGFLAGGGGELYASSDGVTWRIVNASGVVPLSTTGPFVFGVDGDAVLRSEDGGFTWVEIKPAVGGPGFSAGLLGGGAG
jgi:hypothetical protein